MGCAQTRDKTEEQEIERHENNLHFNKHTIPQIKQAFFIPSGPESINQNQLHKAIEHLEIHYSDEEKESLKMFVSAFQNDQNETTVLYNYKNLLLAIFLLSKSSRQDKATFLFDLFDENALRKITREDLEKMLISLVEVVFNYSEKFLDNEEGVIQAHHEIIDTKEEEVMPTLFSEDFTATSSMTKAEFIKWIELTAEKTIDFTDPKSIRKILMDFVLHSKKTQVELQQIYRIRQRKEVDSQDCQKEKL